LRPLRISDVSYMAGDVYPAPSGCVKLRALAVNAAAQYRQLLQLGRDEFVAAAAPAALVRYRPETDQALGGSTAATLTIDEEEIEETLPHGKVLPDEV